MQVPCNFPSPAKVLRILVCTTVFVFCLCHPMSIPNGGLLDYYTVYSEFV
jgi:hypothetical protein